MEAIRIENLTKKFKDVTAVDGLSFKVNKGELFAFLGVNGAGKSTTISVICGQLAKDSGQVYVCGENCDKNIKKVVGKIGVVFQNSVLDSSLTVKDNLKYRASLYKIVGKEYKQRLEWLTDLLNLQDILNKTVSKLSGGQRRRADIARALIHKPEILILDEPTTGLDPQTRKMIWTVISTLQTETRMTVFLTTHYMEEAAEADYVVILDKGKKVATGTPLELKNQYTGDYITLYGVAKEQIEKLGVKYTEIRDGYKIWVPNTKEATDLIVDNRELFVDYEITKGKMDDVFLAVTGKELVGGDIK